jgi:hypothetical protein
MSSIDKKLLATRLQRGPPLSGINTVTCHVHLNEKTILLLPSGILLPSTLTAVAALGSPRAHDTYLVIENQCPYINIHESYYWSHKEPVDVVASNDFIESIGEDGWNAWVRKCERTADSAAGKLCYVCTSLTSYFPIPLLGFL